MQDHYLHLSNESLIPTLDPNQLVKIEDEIMKIVGMTDECWKGDIVWGFHLGSSPAEKRAVIPVLVMYPLTQHTHDIVSKAVNGSPVFYINVDRRFMSTLVVIAPKTDRNSIAFCENYKVLQSLSAPYLDAEHNPVTPRLYVQRRSSEHDYLPPELYVMGEGAAVGEVIAIPDIQEMYGTREKTECNSLAARVNLITKDQAKSSRLPSVTKWAEVIMPMIQGMTPTQRQNLAVKVFAMEEEVNKQQSARELHLAVGENTTVNEACAVVEQLRQFFSTDERLAKVFPPLEEAKGPRSLLLGHRLTPEDSKIMSEVEGCLFVTSGDAVAKMEHDSACSYYHAMHQVVTGRWRAVDLVVSMAKGDRRTPTPLVDVAANIRPDVTVLWRAAGKRTEDILPPSLEVILSDLTAGDPDVGGHSNVDVMRAQRDREITSFPGTKVTVGGFDEKGNRCHDGDEGTGTLKED